MKKLIVLALLISTFNNLCYSQSDLAITVLSNIIRGHIRNPSEPIGNIVDYQISKEDKKLAFEKIKPLNKLIFDHPDSAELYYQRGKERLWLKIFNDARSDFDEATNLGLKKSDLHFQLGKTYFLTKNSNIALTYFNMVQRTNPENVEIYSWLGMSLIYTNDRSEALLTFTKGLQLDPTNLNLLSLRAFTYQNDKQFEMALQDYNKIIELNPDLAEAKLNKCNLLIDLKRYNEACNVLTDINDLSFQKAVDKLSKKACNKK